MKMKRFFSMLIALACLVAFAVPTFARASEQICSYNKSSVKLNLYAGYTLDSLLTAQEEISLDRTITCTSSEVS